MTRKGSAIWKLGLEDGRGTVSTDSGVLWSAAYHIAGGAAAEERGTSPEELIAAAHAASYAMTLAARLAEAGARPESVESRAFVTVEKVDGSFTVTGVQLEVLARVSDTVAAEDFVGLTEEARRTCPVSRLLNTTVVLERVMIARA